MRVKDQEYTYKKQSSIWFIDPTGDVRQGNLIYGVDSKGYFWQDNIPTSCVEYRVRYIRICYERQATTSQVFKTKRECLFSAKVIEDPLAIHCYRPYEVFRRKYYIRRRKTVTTIKLRDENVSRFDPLIAVNSAIRSTYKGNVPYAMKLCKGSIVFLFADDVPLKLKGTSNALYRFLTEKEVKDDIEIEAKTTMMSFGFNPDVPRYGVTGDPIFDAFIYQS